MKLHSRRKLAQGRCVEPSETVARLTALLREKHDFWLHEETVAEHLHWSAMFIDGLDFRAMGKGITPAGSAAGALAEGAEWLTGCETGALPGYLGAREPDVPDALPLAELVNHVASATPPVLSQIRALDEAYHWVDAWSLRDECTRKVPVEYARLISGPNGVATGNHLEEAIIHATLEIFERRAHITVLRGRLVMPTIEWETVEHPVARAQAEFLRSRGIEIILKDFSFGGVLPCVGAYFVEAGLPEDYQFRHFLKVGSAFDREEALLRIFTEYAQGRRQHEFLEPGSANYDEEAARLLDHDFRRLRTQGNDCDNFLSAFMFGFVPYRDADFLRAGERVPFEKGTPCEDCVEDIAQAREICEVLGKDYLAIDLTDPAIGFPVAQVVIPGYSDVLPFHPADSPGLFRRPLRSEVLQAFAPEPAY